jgi:DNA polymerase I-like protein with 3'-5' exonuclease and polymerase domains
MPWADTHADKPLSAAKIRQQGREEGIPVPASFAATSEDAKQWEEKYSDTIPWVSAIRDYRRSNMFLSKLKNIKAGCDEEGIFHFSFKYCGTYTMRGSGGSPYESGKSVNMQNIPRETLMGVDIRGYFIPRPGYKFVVMDYAQIEARYLMALVGDTKLVKMIEDEGNLYQAYAKHKNRYDGDSLKDDDPKAYTQTKVEVLSAGYACGPATFRMIAKMSYGVEFTEKEAKDVIYGYRADNPLVVAWWKNHEKYLNLSIAQGDDTYEVPWKDGTIFKYYDPKISPKGDRVACPVRGSAPKPFYGGKLTGNEVQGSCQRILWDARIAVDAMSEDVTVLWDIHDELVIEVPEDGAQETADKIAELARTCSPWAAPCPIDVEYSVEDFYLKA